MNVVTIRGFSRTGKTTVAEALISGLVARGYSVGSVKEIHFEEFALDTPGTNTDRHKQAGANQVTALGLSETDIMFPRRLELREVLQHYDQDFVVCEGSGDPSIPMIVTATKEGDIAQKEVGTVFLVSGRLAVGRDTVEGYPCIDVLSEPERLVEFVIEHALPLLPGYTHEECGKCGTDCHAFCRAFLDGEVSLVDCPVVGQKVEG